MLTNNNPILLHSTWYLSFVQLRHLMEYHQNPVWQILSVHKMNLIVDEFLHWWRFLFWFTWSIHPALKMTNENTVLDELSVNIIHGIHSPISEHPSIRSSFILQSEDKNLPFNSTLTQIKIDRIWWSGFKKLLHWIWRERLYDGENAFVDTFYHRILQKYWSRFSYHLIFDWKLIS